MGWDGMGWDGEERGGRKGVSKKREWKHVVWDGATIHKHHHQVKSSRVKPSPVKKLRDTIPRHFAHSSTILGSDS